MQTFVSSPSLRWVENIMKEIKKVENEYGLWEITTDDQEQGTNVIVQLVSYWSFYDTTPPTEEEV